MRFPGIIPDLMEIVSRVLQHEKDRTNEVVEGIIDSEEGYLFTNDQEYLRERTDIVPPQEKPKVVKGPDGKDVLQQPSKPQLSAKQIYVNEIRLRIDTYFNLVVRNIRDAVPKAIGYFLVKGIQEKLQYELYAEVNKSESMANTLGEPPEVTAERKTLN